jgi:hypothetical protein
VQDGSESDDSAKELLVGGKLLKGFSGSPEEKRVKLGLVLVEDRAQGVRDGEDCVEVRDVEQVVFLAVDPTLFGKCLAFRAMPVAAGII